VAERQSREELAQFLRSRRQRVRPGDVGFPAGAHRRTVGLRREEVAVLAGVSPTWYTYLEQARDIQPSPEVLDSLARVLRLSEDERRYMHVLAYGHPPPADPVASVSPVNQWVRELIEVYGDVPHPIYATDDIGDLIGWNKAATEWYTDFAKLSENNRNMIWWLIHGPDARDRIVDWEQDARDIIARFRAISASRSADPRLRGIVDELCRTSSEFARWWTQEHNIAGQQARPRRLNHPRHGTMTMRLQVVRPTDNDNAMIMFHLPMKPEQ
jgi:transcriptional regulator with XRE-family HTH domain